MWIGGIHVKEETATIGRHNAIIANALANKNRKRDQSPRLSSKNARNRNEATELKKERLCEVEEEWMGCADERWCGGSMSRTRPAWPQPPPKTPR